MPHRSIGWVAAISQRSEPDIVAMSRRSVASASDRPLGSPLRNLVFGVIYMLAVMAASAGAYVRVG
jgi:hypothetical protein